jgi:hypothetical protein
LSDLWTVQGGSECNAYTAIDNKASVVKRIIGKRQCALLKADI